MLICASAAGYNDGMCILRIELTLEMERGLRENAKRQGMELKAYVEALLIRNLQEDDDEKPEGEMRNEREE